MANGLGGEPRTAQEHLNMNARREPLTVERQGDVLVIKVDVSERAINNAAPTKSGNARLLASSYNLTDGESSWADVGNGIGLNLAVTHRDSAPPRYQRRYGAGYRPQRRRNYERNDW
jgi:hypothetical protein